MTDDRTAKRGAGLADLLSFRTRLFLGFMAILALPVVIALAVAGVPPRDALIVFGGSLLMGIPLALVVSAELARPIRAAKAVAVRAARGEIGARADCSATGEVRELLDAVNQVSRILRDRVTEADASREEVRNSVRRLGEALRSTHDLSKMLSVVLETALVAVGGRSGAVFFLTARRHQLYVKVGRHLGHPDVKARIAMGDGLVGWVAKERKGTFLPGGADAPVPVDPEPSEATALAVPLETDKQLVGVLAIYGRDEPFGPEDLETISSLARQAGIGIENVLLHQEAQRLSITDGLTGLWNYRSFQINYPRELERAHRFGLQFALLVIDIDHFKVVNDRHGHQRGDAILVELAQRLHANIRVKVDFLARYGGEEFILILPETGSSGARTMAEKIRAAVSDEPFAAGNDAPLDVTVSIGYAVYPADGRTPEDLLDAADQAMYAAKARGRDRVVGADELAGQRLASRPSSP